MIDWMRGVRQRADLTVAQEFGVVFCAGVLVGLVIMALM